MERSNLVSKHLVRRDLERDPDHFNQMLWKRKIYKKRLMRNEVKKHRKQYFKQVEKGEGEAVETPVDEKKQEFYKQLFAKTDKDEEIKKKKKKNKK